MNMKHAFADNQVGNIVYVKQVAIADLPDDIQDEAREQADGAETLYAVHREDGSPLALVVDREMAYVIARQNDLSPMTVH